VQKFQIFIDFIALIFGLPRSSILYTNKEKYDFERNPFPKFRQKQENVVSLSTTTSYAKELEIGKSIRLERGETRLKTRYENELGRGRGKMFFDNFCIYSIAARQPRLLVILYATSRRARHSCKCDFDSCSTARKFNEFAR
jgi:hypothetical protein